MMNFFLFVKVKMTSAKQVYKTMVNAEQFIIEKNYNHFKFSQYYTFEDIQYNELHVLEEILSYLVKNKEKDILIFTPRLKLYLISMYDCYYELEQDNYHTLNKLVKEFIEHCWAV